MSLNRVQPQPAAGKLTNRWSFRPLLRSYNSPRLYILSLLLLILLSVAATSASADPPCSTCTPWWGVTTGARPTDLRTGVATSETQELTASPSNYGGGIEGMWLEL